VSRPSADDPERADARGRTFSLSATTCSSRDARCERDDNLLPPNSYRDRLLRGEADLAALLELYRTGFDAGKAVADRRSEIRSAAF
jgi:hypothetical protein